jgi:hypothetical protein
MEVAKRQTIRQNLAEAGKHVRAGERLLKRQQEIIDQCLRDGHDATQAMAFLAILEQAQRLHVEDGARWRAELNKLRWKRLETRYENAIDAFWRVSVAMHRHKFDHTQPSRQELECYLKADIALTFARRQYIDMQPAIRAERRRVGYSRGDTIGSSHASAVER